MAVSDIFIKHKLRQALSKFKNLHDLYKVGMRIFQREPEISQGLTSLFEEMPHRSEVTDFLLDNILKATKGELQGMPTKFHDYLHFVELQQLVHGALNRTWFVHEIEDFDRNRSANSRVEKFRKRLKRQTPDQKLPSIQQEVTDDSTLFRLAFVKKTKRRPRDESALVVAAPCFVVYYPNEPYIYVSKPTLNAVLQSVLSSCFFGSGLRDLELSGPSYSDLRQHTLTIEKKLRDDRPNQNDEDFDLFSNNNEDDDAEMHGVPRLNKIHIVSDSDFTSLPLLQRLHGNARSIDQEPFSFKCTMSLHGPNVLKGLEEMEKAQGVLRNGTEWIKEAYTCQKNVILLDELE